MLTVGQVRVSSEDVGWLFPVNPIILARSAAYSLITRPCSPTNICTLYSTACYTAEYDTYLFIYIVNIGNTSIKAIENMHMICPKEYCI